MWACLAVAFTVALGPLACKGEGGPVEAEAPRVPRVRIADVTEVVPEVGSRHLILLQPWRRAQLSPRYGGQIAALLITEQTEVAEGDLLVRLVDADASGSLMSARASRTSSEARLSDLERQLGDARNLLATGAGTRRDVEQLETEIETTRASIRQAAGQVIQSRDRKRGNTITAPFAGVITSLDAELGEYASPGAVVATLAQLDKLMVDVPLSQFEMVLHEQRQLEFEVRIRGERVEATLEWIAREAESGTNTFPARLSVKNPDKRLRAGEAVEVRVRGQRGEPVLTVPATAVRWEGSQAYVLRARAVGVGDEAREQLERVDVTVHEDVAGRVAISGSGSGSGSSSAPLAVGDRVVSSGPTTLVDGDEAISVVTPASGKQGNSNPQG
jgi:RND family efflux transporter MFP subunit